MQMINDCSHGLGSIRRQLDQPISAELLRAQKSMVSGERSLEYIENLRCLDVQELMVPERAICVRQTVEESTGSQIRIGEKTLNIIQRWQRKYIAVSHRWPAPGEMNKTGKYLIGKRSNQVWDIKLDRIIEYAKYLNCPLFWIDQECIDQRNCPEKDAAIDSMDLVYSLSEYPMALLRVEIHTEDEMSLLADVLESRFVGQTGKGRQRLEPMKSNKARKALELLDRITLDEWWIRGWTFQEDYRASVKMELLIRHSPRVATMKKTARMARLFGSLDNELCFRSTAFREMTTRFCLAFKEACSHQQRLMCEDILQRAAKYTLTLQDDSRSSDGPVYMPMSPIIFADVGRRHMKNAEDLLAITANCCSYQVRLRPKPLQHSTESLSVAILAMYLLNGEIMLDNDRTKGGQKAERTSSGETMAAFLKRHSLRLVEPCVKNELIFLKSCRFPHVTLRKDGILTMGHLWKIGRTFEPIRTSKRWEDDNQCVGLTRRERWHILQLAVDLGSGSYGGSYTRLAKILYEYLEEDAMLSNGDKLSLAKQFKNWMASKLVDAIDSTENVLHLACLTDGSDQASSPYCGIFVGNSIGEQPPQYIFTASRADGAFADVGKHVSLGVNVRGRTHEGHPQLSAKDWIYGLCFYTGAQKHQMVFLWPKDLTI